MRATVRPGRPEDLPRILEIQTASAETVAWDESALRDLLAGAPGSELWVAETEAGLAAFLLWRDLGEGETEVLSLAVAPQRRRSGIGSALLDSLLADRPGDCFLEVRASNAAARALYRKQGFVEAGLRRAYYHRPVEDAVVMTRTYGKQKNVPIRD